MRFWMITALMAATLALSGCSCMDFGYCPELFPKPTD